MMKLNSKEKTLAIGVGLVLVAFGLKMFVFGPILEKISLYDQEIEQSKMSIRKYIWRLNITVLRYLKRRNKSKVIPASRGLMRIRLLWL